MHLPNAEIRIKILRTRCSLAAVNVRISSWRSECRVYVEDVIVRDSSEHRDAYNTRTSTYARTHGAVYGD